MTADHALRIRHAYELLRQAEELRKQPIPEPSEPIPEPSAAGTVPMLSTSDRTAPAPSPSLVGGALTPSSHAPVLQISVVPEEPTLKEASPRRSPGRDSASPRRSAKPIDVPQQPAATATRSPTRATEGAAMDCQSSEQRHGVGASEAPIPTRGRMGTSFLSPNTTAATIGTTATTAYTTTSVDSVPVSAGGSRYRAEGTGADAVSSGQQPSTSFVSDQSSVPLGADDPRDRSLMDDARRVVIHRAAPELDRPRAASTPRAFFSQHAAHQPLRATGDVDGNATSTNGSASERIALRAAQDVLLLREDGAALLERAVAAKGGRDSQRYAGGFALGLDSAEVDMEWLLRTRDGVTRAAAVPGRGAVGRRVDVRYRQHRQEESVEEEDGEALASRRYPSPVPERDVPIPTPQNTSTLPSGNTSRTNRTTTTSSGTAITDSLHVAAEPRLRPVSSRPATPTAATPGRRSRVTSPISTTPRSQQPTESSSRKQQLLRTPPHHHALHIPTDTSVGLGLVDSAVRHHYPAASPQRRHFTAASDALGSHLSPLRVGDSAWNAAPIRRAADVTTRVEPKTFIEKTIRLHEAAARNAGKKSTPSTRRVESALEAPASSSLSRRDASSDRSGGGVGVGAVSEYTRRLLREHNERRMRALRLHQQQQHLHDRPSAGNINAPPNSAPTRRAPDAQWAADAVEHSDAAAFRATKHRGKAGTTAEPRATLHNTSSGSGARSARQAGKGPSVPYSGLENRHAAHVDAEVHSTPHRARAKQQQHISVVDDVLSGISPVSPPTSTAHSHLRSPPQSMTPLLRTSPLPRATPGAKTLATENFTPPMPLVQYLQLMAMTGTSGFVAQELAKMEYACSPGRGEPVTEEHCTNWVLLTALLNQPVSLEHLVVPLLVAELADRVASTDPAAQQRNESDVSHLLGALIGLGDVAKAGLGLLQSMLQDGTGDSLLVGLAVRAVGGEDGLAFLTREAECSTNPASQLRAIEALRMLTSPLVGHTTIMCLGLPQLKGKKMFYQPRKRLQRHSDLRQTGHDRSSPSQLSSPDTAQREADRDAVLPVAQPPYRETHVFLDAALMRRRLLQLCTTSEFAQRRAHESPRVSTLLAVQNFLSSAPFACGRLEGGAGALPFFSQLQRELASWVGGEGQLSRLALPNLQHDLLTMWSSDAQRLPVRQITLCLLKVLRNEATRPRVAEEALRTAAHLPSAIGEALADPLVEYTTALVDNFGPSMHREKDVVLGDLMSAAIAATCSLVNPAFHSQKLIDSATAIAVHVLQNHDARLRRAGCVGIGLLGPVCSNPSSVLHRVVDCLEGGYLNPDACGWALARYGSSGLACLLDVASRTHYAPSQRISAVRAVANAPATTLDSKSGAREATVRGLIRLVTDNMCLVNGEQLAVEGLRAVVALCRTNAEATATLQEVLDRQASGCREAVLRELLVLICRYGGETGLGLLAEIAAPTSHSSLPTRVAATYAMRECGGACLDVITKLLLDDAADVRAQAADTIEAVTVPAFMQVIARDADVVRIIASRVAEALHRVPQRSAERTKEHQETLESWLEELKAIASTADAL